MWRSLQTQSYEYTFPEISGFPENNQFLFTKYASVESIFLHQKCIVSTIFVTNIWQYMRATQRKKFEWKFKWNLQEKSCIFIKYSVTKIDSVFISCSISVGHDNGSCHEIGTIIHRHQAYTRKDLSSRDIQYLGLILFLSPIALV